MRKSESKDMISCGTKSEVFSPLWPQSRSRFCSHRLDSLSPQDGKEKRNVFSHVLSSVSPILCPFKVIGIGIGLSVLSVIGSVGTLAVMLGCLVWRLVIGLRLDTLKNVAEGKACRRDVPPNLYTFMATTLHGQDGLCVGEVCCRLVPAERTRL